MINFLKTYMQNMMRIQKQYVLRSLYMMELVWGMGEI